MQKLGFAIVFFFRAKILWVCVVCVCVWCERLCMYEMKSLVSKVQYLTTNSKFNIDLEITSPNPEFCLKNNLYKKKKNEEEKRNSQTQVRLLEFLNRLKKTARKSSKRWFSSQTSLIVQNCFFFFFFFLGGGGGGGGGAPHRERNTPKAIVKLNCV